MADSASIQQKLSFESMLSTEGNQVLSDIDVHNYILNNIENLAESLVEENLDNIVREAVNNLMQEEKNQLEEKSNVVNLNQYKDDIIKKLINENITLDNYEEIFNLKNYISYEIPSFPDENLRNIRYKDNEGNTVALIQINNKVNKIRLQSFSNILPKQDFAPPKLVNYRLSEKSKKYGWITEDGGINQFDGNIETRYKDSDGKVMAAIIIKPEGNKIDTVVEYFYENGVKTQMLHTSQFGHSKTFYNPEKKSTHMVIDIDTDGNICSLSCSFSSNK